MLDADLQIVDSVTVDISASATPAATTAFALGRRSFPTGACFVIHIEDTSDDDSIDPVRFDLEVTVDAGTTYHKVASIELKGDNSLSKAGPYSVPIGLMDFRAEVQAATDIKVRVVVVMAATGGTDDFTYSAYIGTGNPYPNFSNAAAYFA